VEEQMTQPRSIALVVFANLLVLTASFSARAETSSDSGVQTKAHHVAKKTGDTIEKGAQKTREGITKAAEHTGHALHTAAEKTESALQKAGEKIEGTVKK